MDQFKKLSLASVTLLAAASFSHQASAIVIDGINIGPNVLGNSVLKDDTVETVVMVAGDTLYGVGRITTINSNGSFAAAGTELDFSFTANVAYISADQSAITFNTGTLTLYVDAAGTYDPNNNTHSYADLAAQMSAIAAGTDWLDLGLATITTPNGFGTAGDPSQPLTGGLFGTISNTSITQPQGTGVGNFNVLAGSGAADAYYNTNKIAITTNNRGSATVVGTADVNFNTSFSFSQGAVWDNGNSAPIGGTLNLSGKPSKPVDEPTSIALLGIGLLASATAAARRRLRS